MISPPIQPIAKRTLPKSEPTPKPLTNSPGFPKFRDHLALEKYHKINLNRYWIVPPKDKHSAVRQWLMGDRSGDGLTATERSWLGCQRLRRKNKDIRKLVGDGPDLYDLLVRAHGKHHLSAAKTWNRVHEKYLAPTRKFVGDWVRKCPTCTGPRD